MSDRERISWAGLLVSTLITVGYFQHILFLPADADLFGPGTRRFVGSVVMSAVAISIICEIALRIVQRSAGGGGDKATRDERDRLIDLKACRNGFVVLCIALVTVLAQVSLTERMQRLDRQISQADTVLGLVVAGPLATMHVFHMLLAALSLGAITLHASRVFYYRRGY